jgi:hypothetical protein
MVHADLGFDMVQQSAADTFALLVLANGDPPKLPGPVRHRRGGEISKPDDSAIFFKEDRMVIVRVIDRVEVVKHFAQGDDLDRLEQARRVGESDESAGIGRENGSDHGVVIGIDNLLARSASKESVVNPCWRCGQVPCHSLIVG